MMRKEIDAAAPQSAVDVFVANLFRAHLEPDEHAELREHVKKRAGVGLRQIDQRIKAAKEARAKKEAERAEAAAPSDGRVSFSVPADDAEMTAVMKRIDQRLSEVQDAEPPMRNASGALIEIRERPAIGLHLLAPQQRGQPLPTGFRRPRSPSFQSLMWTGQ